MEVAVRVLRVVAERLQILERLLNAFPNRAVHVLLGPGETIHSSVSFPAPSYSSRRVILGIAWPENSLLKESQATSPLCPVLHQSTPHINFHLNKKSPL